LFASEHKEQKVVRRLKPNSHRRLSRCFALDLLGTADATLETTPNAVFVDQKLSMAHRANADGLKPA
jgi:hypothetical protein